MLQINVLEGERFKELARYRQPKRVTPSRATMTKHMEITSQASQGRQANFSSDERLPDSSLKGKLTSQTSCDSICSDWEVKSSVLFSPATKQVQLCETSVVLFLFNYTFITVNHLEESKETLYHLYQGSYNMVTIGSLHLTHPERTAPRDRL